MLQISIKNPVILWKVNEKSSLSQNAKIQRTSKKLVFIIEEEVIKTTPQHTVNVT